MTSMQDFAASLGGWESCLHGECDSFAPPGLDAPNVSFPQKGTAPLWPADAMGAPGLSIAEKGCEFPFDAMAAPDTMPAENMPVKVAIASATYSNSEAAAVSIQPQSAKVLRAQEALQAALVNYEACLHSEKQQPRKVAFSSTCSGCGTDEPGTGKFCMDCGAKREQEEILSPDCLECGTTEPGSGKFCMECGTKRVAAPANSRPSPPEHLHEETGSSPKGPKQPLEAEAPPGTTVSTLRLRASAAPYTGLDKTAAPFEPLHGHAVAPFMAMHALSTAVALGAQGYCGAAPQAWYGFPQAPPQLCSPPTDNMTPEETVRTHLRLLQEIDSRRVLLVRKINRLGFESPDILKQHYSWYGSVEQVLVSHSRMKWTQQSSNRVVSSRVRPSGMGFLIMSTPEAAAAVLLDGPEQIVAGVTIVVQKFESKDAAKNPQDVDQQNDEVAETSPHESL